MLKQIIEIAKKAGKIQLDYYKRGFEISKKDGDMFDFLTSADTMCDRYIRKQLKKLFPEDKILSEENKNVPHNYFGRVWMVDPLDGTKEFVAKNDQFACMIGLTEDGELALGVVYIPVSDELFYARNGKGSIYIKKGKKKNIELSRVMEISKAILIDRNPHGEERPLDSVVKNLGAAKIIQRGSIGVKIAEILKGNAEIHINSNFRLSKWDVCAPQIILEEAGGIMTDLHGRKLDYKQESLIWEDSVVATNGILHDKVIKRISELLD